jgi:hypothetical protein
MLQGSYKHPAKAGSGQGRGGPERRFFFIAKAFGKWFVSSPAKNAFILGAALGAREVDSRTTELTR